MEIHNHNHISLYLYLVDNLGRLINKWGKDRINDGCEAIISAVAKRTRSAIRDLPDGIYDFYDIVDDDGVSRNNIKISVKISVINDEVNFNFEGTDTQVEGNINVTMAGLQASCLYCLKVLLDPDCPQNHGMLDPITINAPKGSIVNATFPSASAGRMECWSKKRRGWRGWPAREG